MPFNIIIYICIEFTHFTAFGKFDGAIGYWKIDVIKSKFVSILSHFLQPKLNERDVEREKLRKENQLLRDRLNAIHEREQHT